MNKLFHIISILAITCACTFGQTVNLDVQPRVLQLGESATLTLTVTGVGNFQPPAFPSGGHYDIQYVGTERRFSYGTGSGGQSLVFRYEIRPKQMGKISIGPFEYDINGNKSKIPPIEINVAAGGQTPKPEGAKTQLKDLLFAKAEVKSGTVFKQEVFNLTISVYYRNLNLAHGITVMGFPETGFAIKPIQELPGRREIIKNQVYDVARYQCKIHALTSGSFEFEPVARISILVPRKRRGGSRNDPFFSFDIDSFFGRSQRQEVDIKLPPMTLKISDPPSENRPTDYAGAVGNFDMNVQVGPSELQAGEPVTMTLIIGGAGNIDAVTSPALNLGDDFKLYEPRLVKREISEANANGRKVFEQVLIPRSEEISEVPEVTFSYFDPKREEYTTIRQGPFPLTVTPAPEATSYSRQAPGLAPQEVEELGTDIVYLKEDPGRLVPIDLLYKPLAAAAQLIPILLTALVFLYQRHRQHLAGDQAKARRRQAPKAARTGLKKANQALSDNKADAFFDSVWQTLIDYFGHRLNLQPGEISAGSIQQRLADLPPEQLEQLNGVFSACEAYRYASGTGDFGPERLKAILQQLESLMQNIEGRKS